jgi:hypothetical protein
MMFSNSIHFPSNAMNLFFFMDEQYSTLYHIFLSVHWLNSFVAVCVIDDSHSDWSKVKSQCCLIYISFMDRDVKHLLMYFLVICTTSKNCLFKSFVHLLIGLLILREFKYLRSL